MEIRKCILFFLLSLFFFSALPALAGEVRLSIAASMTDVIKELVSSFGKEHPEVFILPNFASSGSLAKQIVQGAPADLYISANQKWMDYLVQEDKIVAATVQVFAYNGLVFVGRKNPQVRTLGDLTTLSLIAIGSPKSVPAGQYAAQAMEAAGVYEQLAQEHKLVMAKDVRQALIYADRGEVDGAFVYRTDGLLAQNAVVLFAVPAGLHDRIAYPLGLTHAGTTNSEAQAFMAYLKSPEAVKILNRYGFEEAVTEQ